MWRLLCPVLFCAVLHAADPSANANANQKSLAALEARFKNLLANCVFDGRWAAMKDGKMTQEYEDQYSIQGATKSGNDVWLIYARIEYGGKDVTVPVPVQLKWAGDTPVITLDKVSIPGLGTYSARVLVYEDSYAGVWSAGDHGGTMHGVIRKQAASAGPKEKKLQK